MNKKILSLSAILFLFSLINIVGAQDETCIYFFYGNGCQHCAKVEPMLDALETSFNLPVEIHKFEIYNNRSNMLFLGQFFDSFKIDNSMRGVPVVFIGGNYLVGDTPIIENLGSLIIQNQGAECPDPTAINGEGKIGNTSPLEKLSSLSLLTVIGAALVDSINPCAIAVLLILTGALLVAGNRKKAIKSGFAFIFSIYIAYFLFGLGLFSAIQISGLSYWFYKIIGIIAIVIGLANIKDFFCYGGGGFKTEIPEAWRPKLKSMLGKVTSPLGAFFMGFVVCLFELPCTGGPYIVILGLLADRMTMAASIPLLLLYNLVFVLPLVILTILVYFGFASVEKATEWKDRNLGMLHLIAGLIMLTLGILITFGFI